MPSKTIYVSDADLPLFDRAQTLGDGNLSGIIARALRAYVTEAAPDNGEILITLMEQGIRTKKRFRGHLVAQQKVTDVERHATVTRVYQTEKGRFVVAIWRTPRWDQIDWHDPQHWNRDVWQDEQRFTVVETHDALRDLISPALYDKVTRILTTQTEIEDLDI